ncbi:septum formation inhibitor Maf [Bacillus salacetis]|uniref:dTTP/UTP pyrophosphatase n=1 Tax=Bacillus salacetis TaxID=2315464 RepID=A0A3A1R8G5_9BACI|nr:Maf family protein [Bacillus salacetis]RIW37771.1 septum formation inhibitor Maf [Bacillus salacetis]
MPNLILASGSPRRKELLQQIHLSFSIEVSNADESFSQDLPPDEVVMELAERKAVSIAAENPGSFVIGSDTVVVFNGEILGKPSDSDHAKEMLRMLSGKTHFVYTGVAIVKDQTEKMFYKKTEVTFWELTEEEIDMYAASGEPLDKAGGYGIQGLGAFLVKEISGDYFSVVGLPVSHVYRSLKEMGYHP